MNREQLLRRLETAWTSLRESFSGLTDTQLLEPGVAEEWSVRDILAHVTTWENEALKYLPVIVNGETPPRYREYGGLNAFNAQMTARKQSLELADVMSELQATHRQLLDYLQSVPEEQFSSETRFRHRLRLDTYSHYQLHARMILAWREQYHADDAAHRTAAH
jgi:hypothetical protein